MNSCGNCSGIMIASFNACFALVRPTTSQNFTVPFCTMVSSIATLRLHLKIINHGRKTLLHTGKNIRVCFKDSFLRNIFCSISKFSFVLIMNDASICSTNRLRLAVPKQSFLNLLRQNGRHATKVYSLLELTKNR